MLANMMTGALQIYIGKNGSSESLLQFGSKKTKMVSANLVFENKRLIDEYEFSLVKAVNDTLIFAEKRLLQENRNLNHAVGRRRAICLRMRHHMQVSVLFGKYFLDAKPFSFMIHPQNHISGAAPI